MAVFSAVLLKGDLESPQTYPQILWISKHGGFMG